MALFAGKRDTDDSAARRGRARLAAPIVALLVQIAAAVTTALVVACTQVVTGSDVDALTIALIQGAVACSASYLIGLDVWWLAIQFAFAPAALAMLRADLQPAIYLAGFLSLLGIYLTTFRTRVPLCLSDATVWRAVQAQLPASSQFAFVDIGSDLGGLLFHLDRTCARGKYEGIEIAPPPWFFGWLRAKCVGLSVRMRHGNYESLDLLRCGFRLPFSRGNARPMAKGEKRNATGDSAIELRIFDCRSAARYSRGTTRTSQARALRLDNVGCPRRSGSTLPGPHPHLNHLSTLKFYSRFVVKRKDFQPLLRLPGRRRIR